jgi:hypothetical protein
MYQNTQWRVTATGLESMRPAAPFDYAIEARRLAERDGEGGYAWPTHMARKGWVDVDAFLAAFLHALETHKRTTGPINLARLERSLTRAHTIATTAHSERSSAWRLRPPVQRARKPAALDTSYLQETVT